MISIQFDSNFPPEIFVPLFGKWIAWKRTLGQVGPKLHALALDFEIYNWPSSYVRVNKESHPANQGGDKKKRKHEKEKENVHPNFVSRQRRRYTLAHLQVQPSLRVWVSVNSDYEPTECSSGSSSCRWGSRNWRSSLVKILTLGGKLRAVASRKELQLNS